MNDLKPVYRLSYLLRLWRVAGSEGLGWRASLENPETGKRTGFPSLEALFAYLMDRCEQLSDLPDAEQ